MNPTSTPKQFEPKLMNLDPNDASDVAQVRQALRDFVETKTTDQIVDLLIYFTRDRNDQPRYQYYQH